MDTKNIKTFLMFVSKHLFVGALFVCGAIIALYGVQAFQSLTPSSATGSVGAADSFNSSLSSPLLTRSISSTYSRNNMSIEAINQKLDSLGANIPNYTPSDILNRNQVAALESATGKSFSRCYSSFVHGRAVSTYHTKCDALGSSFLIVFKSTGGHLFGVYISGGYIHSSKAFLGTFGTNTASFEFSFTGDVLTKYNYINNCGSLGVSGGQYQYAGELESFFLENSCFMLDGSARYTGPSQASGFGNYNNIPRFVDIGSPSYAFNMYNSNGVGVTGMGCGSRCTQIYNNFSANTTSNVAQYLGAPAGGSVSVTLSQVEAFYNY